MTKSKRLKIIISCSAAGALVLIAGITLLIIFLAPKSLNDVIPTKNIERVTYIDRSGEIDQLTGEYKSLLLLRHEINALRDWIDSAKYKKQNNRPSDAEIESNDWSYRIEYADGSTIIFERNFVEKINKDNVVIETTYIKLNSSPALKD